MLGQPPDRRFFERPDARQAQHALVARQMLRHGRWKLDKALEPQVSLMPLLTSFSFSVVSDHCRTLFGSASRRRKFHRL